MKIAIYSDPHFCEYSSIVRKQGSKYSLRIENIIRSINWVYDLALDQNCSEVICAGDFFDYSYLNSAEISALKEINWNRIPNRFLAGNHEQGSVDHSYTSTDVFSLLKNGIVYKKPTIVDYSDIEVLMLPYILESDRKSLNEYVDKPTKKRVIISHNDIEGIQMGSFVSKNGFSIKEIEDNCDLCINGHLHNGQKISSKIINIGNLTGQNFGEDAFKYDHVAFILDTKTLKIEVFENPFAFNFYKLDCTNRDLSILSKLKNNSVITVKCLEKDVKNIKEIISNSSNIVESRVLIQSEAIKNDSANYLEDLKVDHLKQFKEYILENLGYSDSIEKELEEVLK